MSIPENIGLIMKKLEANNMKPYYCKTRGEALELLKTLIPEGATVTHGGSVTISEIGADKLISNGSYNYLDRSKCETREDQQKLYRDSFFADVFLTSSNALTENGELYNVDGNANRISAIAFGPKSVIAVVGVNKIVKDLDAAITRVKTIAAPKNTVRLGLDTYCAKKGQCASLTMACPKMSDGCRSPQRICCSYLVSGQQREKDRIKVVIVNEELGY